MLSHMGEFILEKVALSVNGLTLQFLEEKLLVFHEQSFSFT